MSTAISVEGGGDGFGGGLAEGGGGEGCGNEGSDGEGGGGGNIGGGGDGDGDGGESDGSGGEGDGGCGLGEGVAMHRSTGSHCGGQATPRAEGRAFELRWPMTCGESTSRSCNPKTAEQAAAPIRTRV